MPDADALRRRSRRYWDKHAGVYDKRMGLVERRIFSDTRAWICSQASGDALEVAIGTGLNLDHYPRNVRLTGLDQSHAMLEIARHRAEHSNIDVALREGDALALPFGDASFDTVVCTFSLCEIPDEGQAISEMHRVLRPGWLLLLADHVASSNRWLRILQRCLELITVRLCGEHFLRRPANTSPPRGCTSSNNSASKPVWCSVSLPVDPPPTTSRTRPPTDPGALVVT
jgi:ubiquinone/menaquinone biosynthesis C-methylase UbiE